MRPVAQQTCTFRASQHLEGSVFAELEVLAEPDNRRCRQFNRHVGQGCSCTERSGNRRSTTYSSSASELIRRRRRVHTNEDPVTGPQTVSAYATPDDDAEVTYDYVARRSGKTSIQQVLFEDLNPKKAFFVETTTRLTKHKIECVMSKLLCVNAIRCYLTVRAARLSLLKSGIALEMSPSSRLEFHSRCSRQLFS